MTRTDHKLHHVECGHCGWTGWRKAGNHVRCPRCGLFAAFQPEPEPDDDERPDEPSPEEYRRMKALYDAEKTAGLHKTRAEHEADLIAAGRGHLIRRGE